MKSCLIRAMLFSGVANAYTNKDFPAYLDEIPKKKSCNKLEFFTECKDISHHRGKDYIVFRWHDEASACEYDTEHKRCTAVSEFTRIMIRKGCLISWCKRND